MAIVVGAMFAWLGVVIGVRKEANECELVAGFCLVMLGAAAIAGGMA